MTTKVTLDHKALQAMFDADPEFEIAVKTNILEQALRHRIKMLSNAAWESAAGRVAEEVAQGVEFC